MALATAALVFIPESTPIISLRKTSLQPGTTNRLRHHPVTEVFVRERGVLLNTLLLPIRNKQKVEVNKVRLCHKFFPTTTEPRRWRLCPCS
jgi:hypothetical protein